MNPFSSLGLSPEIVATLTNLGFEQPTDIQKYAIPKVMAGNDLLAIAQTGTGKTAAYALPTIERLKRYANNSVSPAMHPVRMLVLTPTRELADQVEQNINLFVKNLPLKHIVVFGGTNINAQIQILRGGVEIVVATVGRLLDLVEQKVLQLNKVEILVLDEADKMLDMGFVEDIQKIFSLLPHKKQTILFSATFSKQIEFLSKEFLKNPQKIEIAPQSSTSENVEQHIIGVDTFNKNKLILNIITQLEIKQAIIFCNTKANVEKVTRFLNNNQINALAIHGDKSQSLRMETLIQFKQGQLTILVATDVAARGLDITALPMVINYELPSHPEDYVHRIGRTGRAGTEGVAISLVDESELPNYEAIKKLIKKEIKIEKIESFEPKWGAQNTNQVNSTQTKKTTTSSNRVNLTHVAKPETRSRKFKTPETQVFCAVIPGRRKRLRKKEDCALLLPNYGLSKTK